MWFSSQYGATFHRLSPVLLTLLLTSGSIKYDPLLPLPGNTARVLRAADTRLPAGDPADSATQATATRRRPRSGGPAPPPGQPPGGTAREPCRTVEHSDQ